MRRYSKEIHDFIKSHVKGKTTKQLAKLVEDKFKISFSEKQMKSYKTNHKLKSETPKGTTKGQSFIFSKEIQDFIAKNVIGLYNQELCDLINKKFKTSYKASQIKTYKRNQKLSSGLTGYFAHGEPSPNKGKKMSVEQYEKCKHTMFKKGNIPHNSKPIGYERKNIKDGYVYVKIAQPNVWKLKHVLLWEKANGPVPKGHQIMFLDQNPDNIVLENLSLITKKENLILNRNRLLTKNSAINKTAINIARLKEIIINKRKKKKCLTF